MQNLYITSTRHGEGKTAVTLGLTSTFSRRLKRIGFIKPIGRAAVEFAGQGIDEDVILMKEACGIPCYLKDMGPVTIDGGFPVHFLSRKERESVMDRVKQAYGRVAAGKELVVIEGTGNAAAGAAFGLSNAQMARQFGARVLLIASGGIGHPIDEVVLNKSYFERHGVEVAGVVVNKVFPKEMEAVNTVVRKACDLMKIRLFGAIPFQAGLSQPTMRHVQESLRGEVLNGEDHLGAQRVGRIILGAMTPHHALEYMEGQVVLIAPGDREDIVLAALSSMYLSGQKDFSLNGIVLTGKITPSRRLRQILGRTNIPVIGVEPDSFTVASRVQAITAKLVPGDTDRIRSAIDLVNQHVDVEGIIKLLS
jgi:BioD-like phosphotransacetylase family protein